MSASVTFIPSTPLCNNRHQSADSNVQRRQSLSPLVVQQKPRSTNTSKRRSVQFQPQRDVITNALGFGMLSPRPPIDATNSSLLPSPDAQCACASSKTYGKCCRRFHTAQMKPSQAEELLRSRYSAFAYRLPSYIMKTTHSSAIELDRRLWRREILNFCKDYQFVGGIDIVEVQMPAPNTTRILFRANMLQQNAPISFMELATFVCEGNIWYYKSGKLVDIDESG